MVTVREANIKDVDAIYEIGKDVSEFSVNNETVNFWPREILLRGVKSDDVITLIAAKNDRIIGFLIANCNSSLKKSTIENIYVLPEERGFNIGQSLLNKLFSILQTKKYQYVSTLIPLDAKGAYNLYDSVGFSRGENFIWLDKALSKGFKKGETE